MSKTKAQLIEELNTLEKEYKNVKEILMDAWAEGDELKDELNVLKDDYQKTEGELLKYRRRYKALLNAMTPLAAAIIFLAGMVIWLML